MTRWAAVRLLQAVGVHSDLGGSDNEESPEMDERAPAIFDRLRELARQVVEITDDVQHENVPPFEVVQPGIPLHLSIEETEDDGTVVLFVDLLLDRTEIEVEVLHATPSQANGKVLALPLVPT